MRVASRLQITVYNDEHIRHHGLQDRPIGNLHSPLHLNIPVIIIKAARLTAADMHTFVVFDIEVMNAAVVLKISDYLVMELYQLLQLDTPLFGMSQVLVSLDFML